MDEKYSVEVEIQGLVSAGRIKRMNGLARGEVFYSTTHTIIKGELRDQSAMTAFMGQLRDSGLVILKFDSEKKE